MEESRAAEPGRRRRRPRGDALASSAEPARRALVVLGMHRSGTSALTGVLGLAGAGLPAHLMPATAANPRGYFESQTLFQLHEEIFDEAGVTWQDLQPPAADWFRSSHAARWVDRLAKAVLEEFGDAPLLVLKDPRMCRLVPLWTLVFQRLRVVPSYLIAVRHPLEVAASLMREHQMDERKATLLWLDHLLRAEHDTRGRSRTVVAYDHLLSDWRAALRRIGSDLDLPFPRLSRRTEAEIDEFLSRALRHQVVEREALIDREDVVGWVKGAWDWATAASAGESIGPEVLDAAGESLAAAERAFGPLLAAAELARSRTAEEVMRLSALLEGSRGEASARDVEIARLGDELRGMEAQVSLRVQDVEQLRAELETRQHHLGRIVEWVKVLLQWTAQVTTGRPAPTPSLEVVFRALDASDPALIPAVATRGLEVALQAAEAVGLREELAAMTAESKARAAAVGDLERELAAVRAECGRLAAVDAELAAAREQGLALQGELVASHEQGLAFQAELAASQADHAALEAKRSALEAKLDERTGALSRLDRESARMRAELAIVSAERSRSEQVLAESSRAAERLRAHLAEVERELAPKRTALAHAGEQERSHALDLERVRAEIVDRDLYIQHLKQQLDEIERSLSWRAGRPLRAVTSLLRK